MTSSRISTAWSFLRRWSAKSLTGFFPGSRNGRLARLHAVYPFVFMDCIHYKVREEGRILSRAAYVVLGVTTEGYKDILSITVGANETSKFWLGMLNDLKNRGLRDVLFFCVDGLSGFKEAISAVYPQAQIQRCVIHMLRNSFKYVNYQDLKKFSSDFKAVYNAPTEQAALSELEAIKGKWGKKYPYANQQLGEKLGGCKFFFPVFR